MISAYRKIFGPRKYRLMAILFVNGLVSIAFALVDPIAMKYMFDEALTNRRMDLFATIVMFIIGMGILVRLGKLWATVLTQRLKNKLTSDLTMRMVSSFCRTPYEEVLKLDQGYLMSRVYEEPAKVSQGGAALVISLFEKSVLAITALSLAIYFSWRVTLALVVIIPVLYLLSRYFGTRIITRTREENESEAKFRGSLTRGLGAYKVVNTFELRSALERSLNRPLNIYLSNILKRVRLSETFGTLSGVFLSLAESAVLIIAAIDVFSRTFDHWRPDCLYDRLLENDAGRCSIG